MSENRMGFFEFLSDNADLVFGVFIMLIILIGVAYDQYTTIKEKQLFVSNGYEQVVDSDSGKVIWIKSKVD